MIKIWLKFPPPPPQEKKQMLKSQLLYKFEKRIYMQRLRITLKTKV